MAPEDQTPAPIPSLKCTLGGFLPPLWLSFLGLLCRPPFRVEPSALFSHSTTRPRLGVLLSHCCNDHPYRGDSKFNSLCSLAELYMQISSWHFPLNILQSLELNLSKIEFIILLHNPPRVPLRSSPTSQKAGDGTWLFPSHSISSELLLLNLHSAHHGPAPWPLSSSKLRLLPPGITAGGWGPWPLSHQAGENFSMCTSNYITHQFKTQQWLPTTLETKL